MGSARAYLLALLGLTALRLAVPVSSGEPGERASPGARNGHRLTFDSAAGAVLMFGGADHERVLDDLWAWNGGSWRRVSASGPGPRTFPGFAFDESRREAVLFGGNRVLFGPE